MKNANVLIAIMLALVLSGCSKDDTPPEAVKPKSSEKKIIKFYIVRNHTTIISDVNGAVNEEKKTITATIPSTANITRLNPVIEISPKATILPTAGEKDFSSPVTYKVTAQDGTSVTYTVTISQNNPAPGAFELIKVENNSVDVGPTPQFVWHKAEDENDDTVSYDLYVDSNEDPEILVAENLLDTTYTLVNSKSLSLAKNYFWKVVAKDGKGGETSSDIFTFRVRPLPEAKQIPVEGYPTISWSRHSAVRNGNMMFIMGGFLGDTDTDITLRFVATEDGSALEPNDAGISGLRFSPRYYHDAVLFQDDIWISGGVDQSSEFVNDIWRSANGFSWDEIEQIQQYTPRAEHTMTVFQDKLWTIGGGSNGGVILADVWSSSDGATWEKVTETAPFGKRNFHQTVAFNGKLWVIGGLEADDNFNSEAKNDVWSSVDGINWVEEIPNAGFSPRFGHQCLVFDNKIWVIGSGTKNDIWYSEDGKEWFDATPDDSFTVRTDYEALFYNNKIWILWGTSAYDVWAIDYHNFTN